MSSSLSSGSTCPACNRGRLFTRTTTLKPGQQTAIRYNRCSCCENRVKVPVPVDQIRRRARRP